MQNHSLIVTRPQVHSFKKTSLSTILSWATPIEIDEGKQLARNFPRVFYLRTGAAPQVKTPIKRTGEAMLKSCRTRGKRSTQPSASNTTPSKLQEKIASLSTPIQVGDAAQPRGEKTEALAVKPSHLQKVGCTRPLLAVRKRSECRQ